MRPAIHLDEVAGIEVCVALRGAQARVSEQVLDPAKIRTALEQVGGERVTQGVRADPETGAAERDVAPHQPVHAPGCQARAAVVYEQPVLRPAMPRRADRDRLA